MSSKVFSGRICIWGDSITWGSDDTEKGGWVNRLRIFFDNQIEYDVNIYNLGIIGDDTNGLVERFMTECTARMPEAILFAIGINDSIYLENDKNSPRVSLQKFRENLQNLIDTSKKYTSRIGFVGLTKVDESKTMPIPWDMPLYYDNENVEKYDQEIKKIAESNGASYLHIFDLLNPEEFEDGLHPDSKGHEIMFQTIKKFVFEEIIG